MRLVIGLFLATLSTPAHAWEHIGYVWSADDFPIPYQTDILEQGGCGDVSSTDCLEAISTSWAAWEQECLSVGAVDDGALPYETGFNFQDGVHSVTYGDTGPGILGFSVSTGQQFAFQLDGEIYFFIAETDIVLSDAVDWQTLDEVLAGDCAGESTLEATLVHEVGHSLGLGHSCENGEPCADADLLNAVMYWSSTDCETNATPMPDDVDGLTALYGGSFGFHCGQTGGDQLIGTAPMTLDCAIDTDIPMEVITWRFGDGVEGEGEAVTHTWEEEGLYDVWVLAESADETCGDLSTERKKSGYVRVCDVPQVQFELEHILGKTWDIKNQTNIDVLGCITESTWALYQGGTTNGQPHSTFDQWEFTMEFPDEGEWTLVLNVGGPAGTAAAQATLDVRREAGLSPFGCQHGSGPLGAWWVVLPVLGLLRRRRSSAA